MSTELQSADISIPLSQNPGTLGNYLAASGVLSPEALPAFQSRTPIEPANLAQVGLDSAELLNLLLKLIYIDRLHSISQFARGIRLPPHLVADLVRMATDRHLVHATGSASDQLASVHYALTEEGKRWALDALQQCRYAGPAPVTIDDFNHQISLQKLTNETITHDRIRASLSDLVVEDRVIEQSGPAMATSRAMLLYGTPGNGKTSIAVRFASVFKDIIFIPHAVSIDGQIIRVFDPSMHEPVDLGESGSDDSAISFVRSRRYDTRWIPCRRPFIITGGELTLEMLELRYEPAANFYDAPIHVKALGGCLFIDDFGRQLLSPTHLLNRWIVPLESRMDFLRLQSGKTFRIPFEELLIFSTNLDPEDLMDPAFLRRLPYKIEISAPTREQFRSILAMECEKLSLELTDQVFDQIIHGITVVKGLGIAAYHPRFIVEQVAATCSFLGQPVHFHPRFIDNAIDNLRVRRPEGQSPAFTHAHV